MGFFIIATRSAGSVVWTDTFTGEMCHLYDTVNIRIRQVGERDIVPEEEGKPAVVVLEVEAFAHAGGHLVDEAEDALVFAGVLFVHQVGLEIEADVVVLRLFDAHRIGQRLPAAAKARAAGPVM